MGGEKIKRWTRRSVLVGAAAIGPAIIVRPTRAADYKFAQYHNQAASGTLHKNLISESFEGWASPPSSGVVGRFISVTQVGDAASVQLSFDPADKPYGWIDFHNLLRINGIWKITNKTATHSSR